MNQFIFFVRNCRSNVTFIDSEAKNTLSERELYISEKSISLAFKQSPYKLCSLYRIKVIIFSGGGMLKAIFYDFCTPAPHKVQFIGC
jgi:hypothetical protein